MTDLINGRAIIVTVEDTCDSSVSTHNLSRLVVTISFDFVAKSTKDDSFRVGKDFFVNNAEYLKFF